MKVPTWLKDTMKMMVPDLLAEFIGVQSIKRLLNKARGKADEDISITTNAERKGPEIKHGGLFDLSDETNFFDLIGKMEFHPGGEGKQYVTKIASLLNSFPEEWQRRRFRVAVGYLNVDYDTKEISKESAEERFFDGKLKAKMEKTAEKSTTKNLGVQFLVSLAQYDPGQMMEICEASGILHSDFEAIKKSWKKLVDWAENQGPEFLKQVRNIRASVKASPNYKKPEATKPYKKNLFREFFGL